MTLTWTTTSTSLETVDEWSFGPPKDSVEELADGTRLPHRSQRVYLNGKPVGEIEIHLHRRRGRDGKVDVSYGITVGG